MSKESIDRFDDKVVQTSDAQGEPLQNTVTVGQIKSLFSQSFNTKAIRKKHPEIRPETISLARAFIMAADQDFFDNLHAAKPSEQFTVLIDECLAAKDIMPGVRPILGKPFHANFVGLRGLGNSGAGDKPLVQWAINNNIDAILTHDRADFDEKMDLTSIAVYEAKQVLSQMERVQAETVDIDALPLVVRFKTRNGRPVSPESMRLLRKHQEKIRSYLETRTTPYIDVRESGVKVDRTYTELYAKVLREQAMGEQIIERKNIFVNQWMDEILKGRNLEGMTFSQIKKVEDMVRAAAAICTLPSHPRARFTKNGMGLMPEGAHLPK